MAAEGYMTTVYKGPEGESTQWQDIHRKLGNFKPAPSVWKPDAYKPEEEEAKDKNWVDSKDGKDLSDLEDEFADDRFMEEYRQKRIRELQDAARRPRFGSVEEIRGSEFVSQVTNAPPEVWVVVHLYKEGYGPSTLMSQALDQLAVQHPTTKFVKIISTDCIPRYPDTNLPTLVLYHEGTCLQHIVGLGPFGGPKTTPEQVALVLNKHGNFCPAGEEEAGEVSQAAHLKSLVGRMVERREEEERQDESSDFDD
eukprot:CAMPEP_0202922172 /NCGR_PEP_ID=MMETSP1392-20130828/77776_1 /ASSEMBLY_ACC=CAM_ASM_000868 /TAXON_ID=225041 /ORGANISM="Chlamydomonas chlamydogama, Strain SAG 11-48b" /LENGTH=252 /DNA_ID=CAMNT_0049615787 /DNA_START=20 /DNA_END=778 /DNA_ORIENTATION=+